MKKWLKVFGAMFILVSPVTQAIAQVTRDLEITSMDQVDTSSSIFPTVSYEIGEGDLPSEQIKIDPNSLFSDETYEMEEYYDEIVNQRGLSYDYMPKDNFRDITTYTSIYYYYYNPEYVELYAPINLIPGDLDDFQNLDLAEANLWDIYFKNNRGYHYMLTDDLYESFELSDIYTEEMMADMKANVMRIEYILEETDSNDTWYSEIERIYEEALKEYSSFARHYDKTVLEQVEPFYGFSEAVEQNEATDVLQATIQEAIDPLPDHIKHKIGYVGIVTREELPPSWNYTPIDAFATTGLDMFFSEDSQPSMALTYHELGHIIDFASKIMDNAASEEYNSFAQSEAFQAVFEAEWAEEGSYYNNLSEAFAQGFGAYALEYYQGQSMDEAGYEGFGLEGRPLTRKYFEQLFSDLEF